MSNLTLEPAEFEYRQKLEITVESGNLQGNYVSFVEQPGEEKVTIQVPRVDDLYLPLKPGSEVTVRYKKLSARYEFEGEIIERDDNRRIPGLKMKNPGRVKRIQMRDYLRVPCEFSAQMELTGGLEGDNLPRRVNGKIVDISGGGTKFKTAVPVPVAQRVYLKFELPLVETELEYVPGKVIRREQDDVSKKYFLGIEFSGISIEARNDIIQFVYRQQIEMDKKDKWVRE